MTFNLPSFADTFCEALLVCGQLGTQDKTQLELLGQKSRMVASYRSAKGLAQIRLQKGGRSWQHLHVECGLRSFFPKEGSPKPSHRKSEIFGTLSEFIGIDGEFSVVGGFRLLLKEMSDRIPIRTLVAEERVGDFGVKLVGGTFSITGGPVHRIRWLVEGDDRILIQVVAEKTERIDEKYLVRIYDWINNQFKGMFI